MSSLRRRYNETKLVPKLTLFCLFNNSIGNQDVYSILYAAVHDNAWIMDEEYMDQTTTQGLVYCQFQHTANVTLGFKLQYVGEDDDDDSN